MNDTTPAIGPIKSVEKLQASYWKSTAHNKNARVRSARSWNVERGPGRNSSSARGNNSLLRKIVLASQTDARMELFLYQLPSLIMSSSVHRNTFRWKTIAQLRTAFLTVQACPFAQRNRHKQQVRRYCLYLETNTMGLLPYLLLLDQKPVGEKKEIESIFPFSLFHVTLQTTQR